MVVVVVSVLVAAVAVAAVAKKQRDRGGVCVIYMYGGIHKLISCCKCDWRKGNGTANKAKDNGRLETRVCSSRTILAHTQAHTHTHTDSKTDTHTHKHTESKVYGQQQGQESLRQKLN